MFTLIASDFLVTSFYIFTINQERTHAVAHIFPSFVFVWSVVYSSLTHCLDVDAFIG